ncbi:MAG TPA: DUF1835 domain-containing protein [Leucothrix mucor]|nr:DUF1835 domain-containing protein [Leucothrix mucor]
MSHDKKILNITNGDSAIRIMQQAKLTGDFLPWRDVLHDGPVPAGLNLEELSKIRADFIVEQGWGSADDVHNSFIERDKQLQAYQDYDEIILWFEHDLYDQLQILQILDWLADQTLKSGQLSIICTDNYLGYCSPEEILALQQYKEKVSEQHLHLAKKSWHAFRSSTPQKWADLLETDTSILPFLRKTILRLLAEYPSCENGLSLTAQITLKIISKEKLSPYDLFERYQKSEENQFLGDSSFWKLLNELLASNPPLIEVPTSENFALKPKPEQQANITSIGEKVLLGECHYLEMIEIERWIGGVHLSKGNIWCWDSGKESLQEMT